MRSERPYVGERWRKRSKGKQETRTVVDHTLGGSVVYISGRIPKNSWLGLYHTHCTQEEWFEWATGAKLLDD